MGVSPEEWVEIINAHHFKYKFRGLAGWHEDVREACVADEQFMNDWMEKEREGSVEGLAEELKDPPPKEGQEDDCLIESYAQFLRAERWNAWDEPENMNHAPARKVIEKLEPKEPIKRRLNRDINADNLRFDWSLDYSEPSEQWAYIRQDEPEYYLKEHPPEQVWDEERGCGVDVDDVYFFCPGCGRMVLEEEVVKAGHFVCGSCGAGDSGLSTEEFLNRSDVRAWPFQEEVNNVESNAWEEVA
jgi:hypothetical protein